MSCQMCDPRGRMKVNILIPFYEISLSKEPELCPSCSEPLPEPATGQEYVICTKCGATNLLPRAIDTTQKPPRPPRRASTPRTPRAPRTIRSLETTIRTEERRVKQELALRRREQEIRRNRKLLIAVIGIICLVSAGIMYGAIRGMASGTVSNGPATYIQTRSSSSANATSVEIQAVGAIANLIPIVLIAVVALGLISSIFRSVDDF